MATLRETVQRLVSTVGGPLVHAGSMLHGEYCCEQCRTIIVTLVLRSFETNIRIEVKEMEGGVRATSLLCLLGIGLGLGSVLLYRIYSRVISPISLGNQRSPRRQRRPTSSPCNKRPSERNMTHKEVVSPETPDSGISTGTETLAEDATNNPGTLRYRGKGAMSYCWKGRMADNGINKQKGIPRSSSMPSYNEVMCYDGDTEPSLFDGRRCPPNINPSVYGLKLRHQASFSKLRHCAPDAAMRESLERIGSLNQDEDNVDANGNALYTDSRASRDASNSNTIDYASFQRNLQSEMQSTPEFASYACFKGWQGSPRTKRKVAEFTIGEDEDDAWPRRRRNFSLCSDVSASSNFSYRDSLCSKGFSVDLGEALSDLADSEIYDMGSLSVRTESNMEEIQKELRQIRYEINEMNEAVNVLHSREDLIRKESYSLGAADAAQKDMGEWAYVKLGAPRERSWSRSRSISLERFDSVDTASIPDRGMRGNATYDYMWDYQSDLGNGHTYMDQNFLARRPVFGSDISTEDSQVNTSLQSAHTLEHVKKYLDQCSNSSTSPIHKACTVPQSQTNQSIAGIFIDDDYSGLSASTSMDTPPTQTAPVTHSVRLAVGVQCDSIEESATPPHPQQSIVCTNCGNAALSVMNTSFCSSVNSSGILSNYASECSLETAHSIKSRSSSRSTEEVSRAETVTGPRVTKWEVTNVGKKQNIYEYVETGLQGESDKTAVMKKGYHQLCSLLDQREVREIRGDNYCALRAVLYQSLVNNVNILQHTGSLQLNLQKLSVFGNPKHSYLRQWTFANRLPYNKDSVAETIAECLKCLYEQLAALSALPTYSQREEYLQTLLNRNPEVDLQLMEAIKALMMLRGIALHELYTAQKNTKDGASVFAWLLYSRKTSETPEQLFKNHIDSIGDTGTAGQVELYLLGHTLGVKIEVVRPARLGQDNFISHYPDEGADSFPKVYLVAEDDRHYNVVVP